MEQLSGGLVTAQKRERIAFTVCTEEKKNFF
jgi:hypothetical protein